MDVNSFGIKFPIPAINDPWNTLDKLPFAGLIPDPAPGDVPFTRPAWPESPERRAAPPASLDKIRIVEPPCRSAFSRLFNAVNIPTGEVYDVNCRSWRCERHRLQWGKRWSAIIGSQLEYKPVTLLVNLTTAEMIDHADLARALRKFIGEFRDEYGPTEYVKVVEYNKGHTQPHFHLLFCCEKLKIEPMPDWFKALNKERKANGEGSLSWPTEVFDFIRLRWQAALEMYKPFAKPTTVVWCQPPDGSGAKAATYAVGYITGKNAKEKNEEPDSTWKGRKISFSAGFFDTSTAELWQKKLQEWFPDAEPGRFCWIPKEEAFEKPGSILPFLNMPIMKERRAEMMFYKRNGRLPEPGEVYRRIEEVYFEVGEDGQLYYASD